EIVKEYKPRIIVLEELYSHYKHPRTAILMGHVRGVVCLAASMMRVPLVGYSATQVKKSVTGNGKASKEQIQRMVQHFLNIKECPQSLDLTDALALAIAHAFYNGKR
ncbi:MAG: crossover junction endodeoxyribonuclease RuvC, partial [Candidatus Omnitrophica bacterium]|nr:crossover junction endodeoxyribonuclease RuvC [Candidatus Omnitrophota bacterium]